MTGKRTFQKGTIIHKNKTHYTRDKIKLPFRSTKCEIDEYHHSVVSCHWHEVNCKECLNNKTTRRTLKLPKNTNKYKFK